MNEDERGITPDNVTAITAVRKGTGFWAPWNITIEQGNGDVVKVIELTYMEGIQLGCMLTAEPHLQHCSFIDTER